MSKIARFSFPFCLILIFVLPVSAQIRLYPVPTGQKFTKEKTAGSRTEGEKLKLPFFEDFSQNTTGRPDTARWIPGGGTYINNTFGKNILTYNVATFDGRAENSEAYNLEVPKTTGQTDVLESRDIDLSENLLSDFIYFSFYWQGEGFGEAPNAEEGDYLALEFLDNQGEWIQQWKQEGASTETFQIVLFPLDEAKYLHDAFRFRFRTVGRLSGGFDTWNIDYIRFDKDRSEYDKYNVDLAGVKINSGYLKNYSAMPLRQFYANEKAETAQKITADTWNMHDVFNIIKYSAGLTDKVSGQYLGDLNDADTLIADPFEYNELKGIPLDTLPKGREKMILEYTFKMNTEAIRTPVDLSVNDTLRAQTVLDNYYAYDDGSAEYGISVNQKYGKIAVRYQTNKADVLTHIDYYFVPLGTNLKNETFNMVVWKKIDTSGGYAPDSVLYVQNVYFNYSDSTNKFQRIRLNRPQEISGEFYIGFEQLTENNLTPGFDRNNHFGDHIYYNVANFWEQNTKIKGSIMLRPVFGKNEITGTESVIYEKMPVQIYPNPASDILHIRAEAEEGVLLDLTGRECLRRSWNAFEPNKEMQLPSGLPEGLYILQLRGPKGRAAEKVIIRRR